MPIDRAAVLQLAADRPLAQIAAAAGIAAPNLTRILAGQVDPRLSTVERLAKALGVSVTRILTTARSAE